jgi:hypothetical protein
MIGTMLILGFRIYSVTDPKVAGSLSGIITKLQDDYEVNALGNFSVNYRLFRSVPRQNQQESKLQHILQLSDDPGRVFIGIEPVKESNGALNGSTTPFTLNAVPAPMAMQYNGFLIQRMSALWALKQALSVSGTAFELGEIIIRVAEVKLPSGLSRGIVICFETKMEEVLDAEMTNESQEAFRKGGTKLAKKLGVEGAKELWGVGDHRDIIRTWCEFLQR